MLKYLLSIIVFLWLVPVANGQNPALTGNDWILTELSVNGTQTVPSNVNYLNGQDVVLSFMDTGADYFFETHVCQNEAIGGTLSYPFVGATSEQFNLLFSSQALGTCCLRQPDITMPPDPDCVALLNFSSDYFTLWSAAANTTYDYEILSIANTITLRVTKPNGDFALYSNAPLSNDDITIPSEIVLESNPINDKLILSGNYLDQIEVIQIYNLQGKLFLESSYDFNGISVSYLKTGIYILKVRCINKDVVFKLVKE